MVRVLAVLPVFALSAALSAQVSTGMATKGAFGVFANKKVQAVKDATPIKSSLHLRAVDIKNRHYVASASTRASHFVSRLSGNAYASLSDSVWAAAGNNAGTSKLHSVALMLKASKDVKGTLLLSYLGRVSGVGAAGAQVLIGTKKFEAKADGKRHSMELKGVVVGSKGLGILMSSGAQADASKSRSSAAASGGLSVTFVPERDGLKCSIGRGKASCSEGGKLSGSVHSSSHSAFITLKLEAALKQSFAFLLISPKDEFFTLPGSKCIFFKAPIVIGLTKTDLKGNALLGLRIDERQVTKPVSLPTQVVTLGLNRGGLKLATSNSLMINCKK